MVFAFFSDFSASLYKKKTEKPEIILLNHVNYMVFGIYFRLFRLFRHSGKIFAEHGAGDPLPAQGFSYRKHGKGRKVGNNLLKPCKLQCFSHFFPPFPPFSLQKKTEKPEIILLTPDVD